MNVRRPAERHAIRPRRSHPPRDPRAAGAGETTVKELAAPFDISLPAVSKHLKVLERAGLIARSQEAQWRPCRLEAGPMKEVAEWVEHYRRFWGESLDRLDGYLKELQTTKGDPDERKN